MRIIIAHPRSHIFATGDRWLINSLTAANCVEVWEAAHVLDCASIMANACTVIGQHLPEVATQDLFLQLSLPSLTSILSSSSLTLSQDSIAFEAVVAWLRSESGLPCGGTFMYSVPPHGTI